MNDRTVRWMYLVIGLSILACIGSFVLTFYDYTFSDKTENWGQFGDYVGGLMNPLVSILNVFVTIQIARAVNSFSAQQTQHQLNAQKELVKTQLLHEILREFKKDILTAYSGIELSLKANNHINFDASVQTAHSIIDSFIKYHQDMFSFPPGIALSIVTEYNKWILVRNQGHFNTGELEQALLKNKIEIDLMLSLLYSSIIEDAKKPEPKPLTQEILDEWEIKLGLKKGAK